MADDPKKVSTGSIFATAMATTKAHLPQQRSGKNVLQCPRCGAPRTDQSPSMKCAYCDSELREDDGS